MEADPSVAEVAAEVVVEPVPVLEPASKRPNFLPKDADAVDGGTPRKGVKAWMKKDGAKMKPSEKMHRAVMAVLMRKRAGLRPDYQKVAESFPGLAPESIRRMVFAAEHGEIDMTAPGQIEEVKREEVRASHELSLHAIVKYEVVLIELFTRKTRELEKMLKAGTLNYEAIEAMKIADIRTELKKTLDHKTALEKGTMGNLIGLLEAEARRKAIPKTQTNIQNNITVNASGPGSGGLPAETRAAIPGASSGAFDSVEFAIEQAFRSKGDEPSE